MFDTRVWMYRAGESRCFDSPEDVPSGEGWVDSPAKVASAGEKPAKASEEEVEALRAKAWAMGLKFHPLTGAVKLRKLIATAENG